MATNVPLFDPALPENTWKVTGGVEFTFPAGLTLTLGETLLLANFDPGTNATQLAQFRIRYGVPANVQVFGPYRGKLSNDRDEVELRKPTAPLLSGVPYVLVDRVAYRDSTPWPAGADGYGLSLQRADIAGYGDDPANWFAARPTAGSAPGRDGVAPSVVVAPQSRTAMIDSEVLLNVTATGTGPLQYQWRFNGRNLDGATNALLRIASVRPSQSGQYAVVVFNQAGSTVSASAFLTLIYPPSILTQPQSVGIRGSTNVADYGSTTNRSATFSVSAYSPQPLSYQWRSNGVPITDATAATLTVSNVALGSDATYDVLVSDGSGSRLSAPARLSVLLTPQILVPPVNQFLVPGGSFTASVQIRGNPPPFGYIWRQGGTTVSVTNVNSTNHFITRTNVQPAQAGLWRVIVTNAALPFQANATFTVTILPDDDGDGLPDDWEVAHGFPTNDLATAGLDSDADNLTNLQEYRAGTDPTNAWSYLRIDSLEPAPLSRLSFFAVSNRTYSVEHLPSVDGAWLKLVDIPAHSTNRFESIEVPFAPGNGFFRLRTPVRP
jgi:hypothetical protein